MNPTTPHLSVLKNACLHYFEGKSLKIFIDCTLGAGGHSAAFLEAHPEIELLIGIDQDDTALAIAREKLKPWESKVRFIKGNFRHLARYLDEAGISEVDGILMDLGVSSMQLDMPEKGFSFMRDGPLDMRMNPEGELLASTIVNEWSERDLCRIFRDYGEEKRWRGAAHAIVKERQNGPITTTLQLANLLDPVLRIKSKGTKGIHPLTLVFQALRICVNSELEVIREVLPAAIKLLKAGGRLAVISFHSLEDRIVKNTFSFSASDKYDTHGIGGVFLDKVPEVTLVTRKPVIAADEEVLANPRSRSAKLRVAEKR